MAFVRFIGSTDVRTANVIWRAKPIPAIATVRWRIGTYASFSAASVRLLFFASATTPTTVRKTVFARSDGASSNLKRRPSGSSLGQGARERRRSVERHALE